MSSWQVDAYNVHRGFLIIEDQWDQPTAHDIEINICIDYVVTYKNIMVSHIAALDIETMYNLGLSVCWKNNSKAINILQGKYFATTLDTSDTKWEIITLVKQQN